MIINCSYLDKNFEIVEEGNLVIKKGKILECNYGFVNGEDFKNFLVIPCLINAHTHIGDSFAKDAIKNLNVKEACGKNGIKWKFYKEANNEEILNSIRNSALQMISFGICAFADFREFGVEGVKILKESIKGIPIDCKILARNIKIEDLNYVDGIGINIYNLKDFDENFFYELKKANKIFAVHAGECEGEIKEILNFKFSPDIIVHFLNPSDEEIEIVKKRNINIVLCPRSNFLLKSGIPDAGKLIENKINVCVGTDNFMLNSPNLWREIEFLYKISSLKNFVEPKEILKMVTINAAKALNLNCGVIDKNKDASLIFINKNSRNLKYSKDLITSLVNRCEKEDIEKIMIKGEIVEI
ncbi:MAG: amidohydrolase family protein [Candidatus Altarchaeaceae archaeon]